MLKWNRVMARILALGLVLGVPLVTSMVMPVQALDQKEVFTRLNQIPVFTLLNEAGNPVLVKPKTEKGDTQYAAFFLFPQEVKDFEAAFKRSEPNLASKVKIQALPLGEALRFAEEQRVKKQPVKIDLIPRKVSTDYALTLAKQLNKDVKQFPGVPIFALTDLTGKKVVSIQRKDLKGNIPAQLYFFDETDAKLAYEKLKQSNGALAKQTRISAAPLQNLLGLLLKLEKPTEADRIVMLPSQESLKYAQSILKTSKK